MKNIGLFCVLFLVTLASCKSKKGVHQTPKTAFTKKEYRALSEKLNLEINKSDNIKLYKFIGNWLGVPHKLGSCSNLAIDCSCFIQLLHQQVYGNKLPRTAADMQLDSKEINMKNLSEGDLVFFKINAKKVSHVGVYLKEGWFAHVSTSKGVMINNLNEAYYQKYYTSAGRVK
jgi:cell wall-associated NlpC family hydrolase